MWPTGANAGRLQMTQLYETTLSQFINKNLKNTITDSKMNERHSRSQNSCSVSGFAFEKLVFPLLVPLTVSW